jgi:hypothetical protein
MSFGADAMKAHPLHVIAICLMLLLIYPAALEAAGPKLVVKEAFYDAKDVKEGQVIAHALVVSNPGDQVLKIRDVNSD